jgi:hypothetical protein
MRFQLYALPTQPDDSAQHGTPATLDAAQCFVGYMTRLSPIAKYRLRYMCDYGFVMIAYACVFIIRALSASTEEAVVVEARRRELLGNVIDAAALMQSYMASKESRPAVYGHALDKLCADIIPSGAEVQGTSCNPGPAADIAMNAGHAASSTGIAPPLIATASRPEPAPQHVLATSAAQFGNLQNNTNSNHHIGNSNGDGDQDCLRGGEGGTSEQVTRTMSALWSLNQNFPLFEDIMFDVSPDVS